MANRSQDELAARWKMSPRTLEQWRWLGKGPKFLRLGARVLYPDEEFDNYEARQPCQNTVGPLLRDAE